MSIFNDDVFCPGFSIFDSRWLKVLFVAFPIFLKNAFFMFSKKLREIIRK